MRTLLVCGLAATVFAVPPGPGQADGPTRPHSGWLNPRDDTLGARVNALVKPEADAELLSGVILLARGDHIFFQRAYGYSNWELRVPNSMATRFGIASITKAMTEFLVDTLVDEGSLDIEAPVASYLPGFPNGPKGGVPTVRQLLTNRSGVPHRVTDAVAETQPLQPADIVELVKARGLVFEPGTQTLYSSAGFTCLARVIEVVEQEPFESVLVKRIFRPASMSSATDETGQQLMPRRAMPYRLGAAGGKVVVANARYKDLSFLTGAGSVYATAGDLLHFIRAARAGLLGNAAREQVADSTGEAWRSWYGRTNGYEGSVDYLPSGDLTVVFLTNLQSAVNWQVREQIQSMAIGRKAAPIQDPPAVAPQFEAPASFAGSYGDPDDPVAISELDGKLFRDDNEFYPIEGGRYYTPASGSIMRFRRDETRTIDAIVTTYGNGSETVLPRIAGR